MMIILRKSDKEISLHHDNLEGNAVAILVLISGSNNSGKSIYGVMLSDLVYLTTDAILLGLAGQFFKTEQAAGTPFTEDGANRIRKLGIHCIWMPIVAVVIASVITVCLGVEQRGDVSNLPGVVTGIVLILASLIFSYGAQLEAQNRSLICDGDKN